MVLDCQRGRIECLRGRFPDARKIVFRCLGVDFKCLGVCPKYSDNSFPDARVYFPRQSIHTPALVFQIVGGANFLPLWCQEAPPAYQCF